MRPSRNISALYSNPLRIDIRAICCIVWYNSAIKSFNCNHIYKFNRNLIAAIFRQYIDTYLPHCCTICTCTSNTNYSCVIVCNCRKHFRSLALIIVLQSIIEAIIFI